MLRIPPGPPTWQLKLTRSANVGNIRLSDYIIIGDEELAGKSDWHYNFEVLKEFGERFTP